MNLPVASHILTFAPADSPVLATHPGPAPWSRVEGEQLVLFCGGTEICATVWLVRHDGPPTSPAVRPGGSAGGDEPDEVNVLSWQLESATPVCAHVLDYGTFPLPDIGLRPGRWGVRASVWGRDDAQVFEEVADMIDPDEIVDELPPLGPEEWLLEFWPL